MGAHCCVAAREKPLPDTISCELSSFRNVRHSPSWSFRWDNRTHIEDIMDNQSRFSHHHSGNIGSESKSAGDTETEVLSDGFSPSGSLLTSRRRKRVGFAGSSKSLADQSTRNNPSAQGKGAMKSLAVTSASDLKPSVSLPSLSSSSPEAADPSLSVSFSLQSEPSSSRKARRSPGYQLSRQVSDSRIPSLKSLNESTDCSPEARQSFVLSFCSNDLSAGGSHGGSSDGWSMRTFTELVAASSQKERWSLDSETPSSVSSKFARSPLPSADTQTCRICSKLLKEKSPWGVQKIVSTNEVGTAAVLVCGHVYHAECLESITSAVEQYDPPCPVCTNSEKLNPIISVKAGMKARNKISRRAVADIDVNGNPVPDPMKWGSKSPSIGAASSSTKARPFLRRHFSISSRPPPARSASDSDSTRKKKGFWSRSRRD